MWRDLSVMRGMKDAAASTGRFMDVSKFKSTRWRTSLKDGKLLSLKRHRSQAYSSPI